MLREFQEILGGGPLAGACAFLLVAVIVLFLALQREQRSHLKTVIQVVPLAQKLLEIIELGRVEQKVIRENAELLKEVRGRLAGGDRPAQIANRKD